MLPLILLSMLAATVSQERLSVTVTGDTVCSVQHAIRWRQKALPLRTCARIARATNSAAQATGQRPDTLLAIQVVESDLRPGAEHWHGRAGDLGLMGVHCKLGVAGRCTNNKVRGLRPAQIMRIENNIMLGARILTSKPTLNDYNGGEGYADRVLAVRDALNGVEAPSPHRRIRKLAAQILGAEKAKGR
jgi:soluble lytic murein transglycosylase-like protein